MVSGRGDVVGPTADSKRQTAKVGWETANSKRQTAKRVSLLVLALGAALALVASACGGDDADSSDVPAATPTPGRIVVDAPIDEAELITRESFPPQYAVRVVVGITDGCHEFESVEAVRAAETITIVAKATTIDDREAVCTQIYGTHEETVELGSDFDAGVTYTVVAGDFTFEIVGEGE
ncbi:MAG: hypothetical protein WEB52_09655 [Dehalococcoidia bacterium]